MNGHDRRKQRIKGRIETSALDLFTRDGADKVSMDAIAAKANVSKVTIYNYFHSKEELYKVVINRYLDENLAAIEEMLLKSELDFTEKLKITLVAQMNSLKLAGSTTLFDLLEKDDLNEKSGQSGLKNRIKGIMYRFYEQGKKEGYINEGISFELLYLFSEIFQAGFKARWKDYTGDAEDAETLEQLVQLCFYGIMRRS